MAILKIKVSQKLITKKCTIMFNFNAVKIKWQVVFLWISWSKLSNSDSSRQQCLWWSYTSLSSWTQGAAVKGLNYLCLFAGSWRCRDTERLPLRAFAHIIELSVGRLVATDRSEGVWLSKDKNALHVMVTPALLQQRLGRTVWVPWPHLPSPSVPNGLD